VWTNPISEIVCLFCVYPSRAEKRRAPITYWSVNKPPAEADGQWSAMRCLSMLQLCALQDYKRQIGIQPMLCRPPLGGLAEPNNEQRVTTRARRVVCVGFVLLVRNYSAGRSVGGAGAASCKEQMRTLHAALKSRVE
jgi:hypothetical protein